MLGSCSIAYAARESDSSAKLPLNQRDKYSTDLFTGSSSYSYTLNLPKGTNGLTPEVKLSYNSLGIKDATYLTGIGWQLEQDYIERDVNFTPNSTSDDKYKLVFQGLSYELIEASGGRYHTKTESNLHITKYTSGGQNGQGAYWEIITPNGTKYSMGYGSNAELICSTQSYVTRWNLNLVTDVHDNKIYYYYIENSNTARLSRIEYNNEKSRNVEFTYEGFNTTNNIRPYYLHGCLVYETHRIKHIHVNADTEFVRQYNLNYTTIPNGQYVLSSIAETGNASSSALPATTFSYNPQGTTWNIQHTPWLDTQDLNYAALNNSYTKLLDVNGDGLADIVRATQSNGYNTYTVHKNTGTTWTVPGETWVSAAIEASFEHENVRLVDVTGDGLPDIVKSTHNGVNVNWYVYRNTGYSWNTTYETWINYKPIDTRVELNTVTMADVNGDGLTDIIKSYEYLDDDAWLVYMNTGSSWNDVPEVWAEANFDTQVSNDNVRVIDVNGDKMVDIVKSVHTGSYATWYVYLNTGSSWNTTPLTWINNADIDTWIERNDTIFSDVNGDGLQDIVRVANGTTSCRYTWKVLFNKGDRWSTDFVYWWDNQDTCASVIHNDTVLTDVTGDSLPDIVKTSQGSDKRYSTWHVHVNNGYAPYLLDEIKNPNGGTINFDYKPSSKYDNTGSDSLPDLPFVLWVVEKMTKKSGMTGLHATTDETTYSYTDGAFDAGEREFRGFGTVDTVEPNSAKKKYVFNQDDIYKGLLSEEQTRDASNNPYTEIENTWSNSTSNGITTIKLDSEKRYTYDGTSSNPKVTQTDYQYDIYNNVTKLSEKGDTSSTADDRFTYTEYVYNTTDWIVSLPKHTYLHSSDDTTKISEKWIYYDGSTSIETAPSNGDMTKEIKWLNGGTNIQTIYSYDSYGNITSVTDANNNTTQFTYGSNDWTYTYPNSTTNAKSQTSTTLYNLGTGNIISKTDPNGNTTSYTYDTFGRILKEIKPYDSTNNPTTQYTYYVDGNAPDGMLVSKRETASASAVLDTYAWVDGLGRTIQTRTETENTLQQIVSNTFYDANGQVKKMSVPHFDTYSTAYATPVSNIRNTSTTFDAINRPLVITNPKGDEKSITYDHWKQTIIDENGHTKKEYYNAFGKINKVEEINGNSTYTTTYTYDSRDLLTKITNNNNNDITLTYDSLGRRITQVDPDLGTWTYVYDAVGNIISQTDNRNITTTKTYDQINRLTTIDYPTQADVTFTYDIGKIGVLSIATDSAGTVSYSYDNRLRKTNEQRTVNGVTKSTQFSFDSLDRMDTQTNPDGEVVNYSYNSQGEVESMSGSSSILSNVDYNALGKITKKEFANGLDTDYTYNTTDFRLNRIQTGSLQDLNYTYDKVGNVKSISDTITNKTQNFAYDDLDRLITASESAGYNQSYEYNSIGNLTKATDNGNVIDYNYGANGKAHALTSSTETIIPTVAPDPAPSIFSLTENWSSGNINTSKWVNWGGGQVNVVNQELTMTSTSSGGYYGLETSVGSTVFDITNAHIVNQLVDAGNQSITSWQVFPVYIYDANNSTNSYYWMVSGNTIKAIKQIAGVHTDIASTAYNTTNHKWFRIRESNNIIYFDSSANGQTWTNFTSTTEGFDGSSIVNVTEIGTWQTESSTTTAVFDNLSISTPSTSGFSDTWAGGSINPSRWHNWSSSHASISNAQLSISSATGGGYFGLDSGIGGKVYNLTNASAQNQLVSAGNLSIGSLEVYPISVSKDSDTAYGLHFFVAGAYIRATYSTPTGTTTVKADTYNATNHQIFRIRETSGTIYWDTSADGATWTNFTSVAKPFDITAVRVGVMVGTWQTESSTTAAVFDNFNVISKATSSVADGWNTGTLDATKWENWGGSQVALSNQQVAMTSTTGGGYYGLDSGINGNVYNLTGSSISNQLISAGNQSLTSWEVYPMYAYDANNSTNSYYWMVSGNTIKAFKQVSGSHTELSSGTYNTTNHKWFRIREAGGTTYFDTSADGSTWNNFSSTANAFTATSLIIGAEIGTWQAESSTTTAVFDNFNAFTPVYTYDANGNMTSDGTTCYHYNEANQMDKVTKCATNQVVAEYVYDYNGNRMVKKNYTNGAHVNTVTSWSDSYETKVNVGGSTENTTYYFANKELFAKKNPDGSKYYYHNDHLGSASVLSSSTGALVESTTYDPWGNIKTGGTKSKFLYTGQEHDSESKLHYYNARYYDPHIRRFTQPDTFIQDVYNPQSLNRYSYVLNNPLKYTDPTGHFWQKIFTPSFWVSAWQNTVKVVNFVSTVVSKVSSYVRMTPPSVYKPPAPPPNQPLRINPPPPPASTSTGNAASTNISGQVNMQSSTSNITTKVENQWYKSTFNTVKESINYHVQIHGAGRTPQQYTKDARQFFKENSDIIQEVTLKDGTEGIKIKSGKQGGYFKPDGRIVTYWD